MFDSKNEIKEALERLDVEALQYVLQYINALIALRPIRPEWLYRFILNAFTRVFLFNMIVRHRWSMR